MQLNARWSVSSDEPAAIHAVAPNFNASLCGNDGDCAVDSPLARGECRYIGGGGSGGDDDTHGDDGGDDSPHDDSAAPTTFAPTAAPSDRIGGNGGAPTMLAPTTAPSESWVAPTTFAPTTAASDRVGGDGDDNDSGDDDDESDSLLTNIGMVMAKLLTSKVRFDSAVVLS